MERLRDWLKREADREQRSARLESALLTGSFSEYFVYRLRYFVARALASSLIRTIKILFLFRVFSTGEFVVIIVVHAGAAIVSDLWWGALEQMRGRIRHLQRSGSRHRIAAELGRWLRLSVRLSAFGVVVAFAYLAVRAAPRGRAPTVAELYVAAVIIGAAIELTVRTYHSGCYAIRRVYRPLPSMVAADIVSLGLLLASLPLIGEMAFPAAELTGVLVAAGISIHYTAQTGRLLGFPSLRQMLAEARAIPSLRALLSSLGPAFGYATIGVESLIVLTVLASGETASKATLVVFLAALSPAIRAGFEWARLLYFDLKRLELPLLRELRKRFDAAMLRLAVVLGVVAWGIAVVIASTVLEIHQRGLLRALLPFFVVRSLLAAVQIRAFTAGAYLRLVVVGVGSIVGFAAVILVATTDAQRIMGLALTLAASAVVLFLASEASPPSDAGAVPLLEWIDRLRITRGPVTVTSVAFDEGPPYGDVTAEAKRMARWRERRIARRVWSRVKRRGGAVASPGPWRLIWFQRGPWTEAMRRDSDAWLVGATGGLLRERADHARHADGPTAAAATTERLVSDGPLGDVAASALSIDHDVGALVARFRTRFPGGHVVTARGAGSESLARLSVADRQAVLRAAMAYAETLEVLTIPRSYEVTSFSSRGSLRLMFMAPRSADPRALAEWRATVRAANLLAAANHALQWGMLSGELPFRGGLDGSRGR